MQDEDLIWGDVGRRGEMWGGVGRCRETWGDAGRRGEMWGDVGRCGETWGDVWTKASELTRVASGSRLKTSWKRVNIALSYFAPTCRGGWVRVPWG